MTYNFCFRVSLKKYDFVDWLGGKYDHIVPLKLFLTAQSKYHVDAEQNLQHSSFYLIKFGR